MENRFNGLEQARSQKLRRGQDAERRIVSLETGLRKTEAAVKRNVDQSLRLHNFDARYGKIETGAVVKNRKGLSGVKGGRGTCYQWKEKVQCSKGNQCSFHESNDRAQ